MARLPRDRRWRGDAPRPGKDFALWIAGARAIRLHGFEAMLARCEPGPELLSGLDAIGSSLARDASRSPAVERVRDTRAFVAARIEGQAIAAELRPETPASSPPRI